ncbi:MAG: LysR family transcriptional regulator [Roseibium sp.]|uniref:LysR family transcriptional regulator n=1 Tax=Roseibium sp. TaxID=1936156 RepID=UPI001B18B52E|nr:LysR family transcriptional regulator [Roseibium sp.]MBO6508978.1 LysR family transcriptional regulator [Roseibium sp.]MBO6894918.1 LysR family transcriptional regulator [Roseibium sp.]MBO6930808.1 LysR family transcriptional regulator [Roseibium sp.]
MDFQSLRLFVLAADRLNISAAGRELGMAPAVASSRLAKLEQNLGADLLHRSTRKVSLSLEGAEFLPYAREILAQEDAARAALGMGKPIATGTLRFAASSTFAQLYIVPILNEFLEDNPGIDLDLRLSDTPFDLIEGSFDLALRNSAFEDTSMKGRKLADDRRVLCASPDYLKRKGVPRHPDELNSHQLLAFRNPSPRQLVNADGDRGVFDPRGANCRLVMDDGLSQKLATLSGVGISTNSLWSVHRELDEGKLVRVLPDFEVEDPSVLWLVYPKSNVLTAKVRVFIDFLLKKIGRHPEWERSA